ncbi:hypothetical protein DPMN_186772 [Dreissena polymorpha]|uniref:Uncharacterized protein n=1 Tax=Dreissena polymorpha TaxID=45954 RepID=A0A9D4DPA5_DREPO|nr:hypothetical protein DPMN_186772 [Dreissena polymorpha]
MADNPDEDPSVVQTPTFTSAFNTRAMWEKMQERNQLLERVDGFAENAVNKKQMIMEVNYWLQDNLNMVAFNDIIFMPPDRKIGGYMYMVFGLSVILCVRVCVLKL